MAKNTKTCPICQSKRIPNDIEACDECTLDKYDLREEELAECGIYGLRKWEVAEGLRRAERGDVTKTHRAWLRIWEDKL